MAKFEDNEEVVVKYQHQMYTGTVQDHWVEYDLVGAVNVMYHVDIEYPRKSGEHIVVTLSDRAIFRHPLWKDPKAKPHKFMYSAE